MNVKQIIGLLGLVLLIFYGHRIYLHLVSHSPLDMLSSCSGNLSEPQRLIVLGVVIVIVVWACKQGR